MAVNYETSENTYTHYKLRSTYASLCANLDYLFTCYIVFSMFILIPKYTSLGVK